MLAVVLVCLIPGQSRSLRGAHNTCGGKGTAHLALFQQRGGMRATCCAHFSERERERERERGGAGGATYGWTAYSSEFSTFEVWWQPGTGPGGGGPGGGGLLHAGQQPVVVCSTPVPHPAAGLGLHAGATEVWQPWAFHHDCAAAGAQPNPIPLSVP